MIVDDNAQDQAATVLKAAEVNGVAPLESWWKLQPATVVDAVDYPIVAITVAGDSQQIPAISLIGQVAVGARVMVIFVPPAGYYIVGVTPVGVGAITVSSGVFTATVSTTSASYVSLGTGSGCGVAFVAPVTGRVVVHWRAQLFADTSTTAGKASIYVGTGEGFGGGSAVQSASDSYALMTFGNTSSPEFGATTLVSGLTPGSTYNVQMQHRRSAGAGNALFANREIVVAPTA